MAESGPNFDEGDIESLVGEANEQAGVSEEQTAPPADVSDVAGDAEALIDKAEADLERALAADVGDGDDASTDAATSQFEFQDLSGTTAGGSLLPIDALQDVELDLRIELGRTQLLIEDVMKLVEGSVVQLDKLAGDPVDILVNGRLIARGEILVLNDNFCVRIAEILSPDL